MKCYGDLDTFGRTRLALAQATLREAALMLAKVNRDDYPAEFRLYLAARNFDTVCRDLGLAYMWLSEELPYVAP